MGEVVEFPSFSRPFRFDDFREEPATVIVLPVVRIEQPGLALVSERTSRRVQHELAQLREALARATPDCFLFADPMDEAKAPS